MSAGLMVPWQPRHIITLNSVLMTSPYCFKSGVWVVLGGEGLRGGALNGEGEVVGSVGLTICSMSPIPVGERFKTLGETGGIVDSMLLGGEVAERRDRTASFGTACGGDAAAGTVLRRS